MRLSEAMPLVCNGSLKTLAITSPTRYPAMPPVSDVPGMSGFAIYPCHAPVVRAGTHAPIAARLNEAVIAVLKPLMICRDPTPRTGFHQALARLWGDEASAP